MVIALGRVKQQECMASWRGIYDYNFIFRLFHNLCKSAKHGNFLCTGRAQVLLDISNILIGHGFSCLGKNFILIFFQFSVLINVAHCDAAALIYYKFQMRRRIGCGKVYFLPFADNPIAIAAAMVVLPTPPLPMVKITFLLLLYRSSMTSFSLGIVWAC